MIRRRYRNSNQEPIQLELHWHAHSVLDIQYNINGIYTYQILSIKRLFIKSELLIDTNVIIPYRINLTIWRE